MKVGVITWFTGPNYGTVLQAISLQKVLSELGYSPELINFEPPTVDDKLKISTKIRKFIPNQIFKIKRFVVNKKYGGLINERNTQMSSEINSNCKLSSLVNGKDSYIGICNSYDAIVVGSDQIWNPNWFHPYYFADYKEIHTPRIAYAPSMGVTELPINFITHYQNALSKFKKISAREDKASNLITNITNRECIKVVDPTLLLRENQWDKLFNLASSTNDKYILAYFIIDNPKHIAATEKYSRQKGISLKVVPYVNNTYFMNGDIEANAGAKKFLELIKNAECVITDSFHGMIFSIIFKKEFYIFPRFNDKKSGSQNSRIYQITNEYGLEDRLQKYNTSTIEESSLIDYKKVYDILNEKIDFSKSYLNESLEEIENSGK